MTNGPFKKCIFADSASQENLFVLMSRYYFSFFAVAASITKAFEACVGYVWVCASVCDCVVCVSRSVRVGVPLCVEGEGCQVRVLQTYIFIVHYFKNNFLYLLSVISSFTST